jgi:hypothetical protein
MRAMQGDGNCVIYGSSGSVRLNWGTNGKGKAPYRLVMQVSTLSPCYCSFRIVHCWRLMDAYILQDDGNLVLYGSTGSTWASNTVQL